MSGNGTTGRWKMWSGVIAVFVIGVVIGGLATTALIRGHFMRVMKNGPPPRIHESIAQRLTRDLGLTVEQRERIERITAEYEPRFGEFEQRSRAEVREIAQQMEERIREILTPEQQVKFDAGIKKMQEDMRKREDKRREKGPWHEKESWDEKGS
jgi:Spy/CpxP family protein refolding chaperone